MTAALHRPDLRLAANRAARTRAVSRRLSGNLQYARAMRGEHLTVTEWTEVGLMVCEVLVAGGCALPNVPEYLRRLAVNGPAEMVKGYEELAQALEEGRISVG